MDLQLRAEPYGERAVVHVAGEIDLATCPRLRAALLELTSGGVYHLLIDLAQVSFLDSSGIGVLIGALHRVRQHQGSITLVAPTPRVRQVLGLTGITRVLPVHASLNEALVADPARASRETRIARILTWPCQKFIHQRFSALKSSSSR